MPVAWLSKTREGLQARHLRERVARPVRRLLAAAAADLDSAGARSPRRDAQKDCHDAQDGTRVHDGLGAPLWAG